MKVLFALLLLVGIVSACSPDPVINITTTNHYYYKKIKDSIPIEVQWPVIDTLV